MKRTQSSEIPLDNINLSLKINRVPYMGCQSLMYQTKITKETVLRQNKSLNISMEEVTNIPTSVLIHQSSPQSIPSFSTYHSDETVYNETYENTEPFFSIYDFPLQKKCIINESEKEKPQNNVVQIRNHQKITQCQSFTSSNASKRFLPFCGGNKSPSVHRSMTVTNEKDKPLSFKTNVAVETTQPLPPLSYQSTCWKEFLSTYLTNGAKSIFWTRPSLKHPLLNYVLKNQGKNAVKSFKIIQKYMGDRRTRKSPSQLLAKLQSYVSFNEAMRDEVLLQICKQTINNPDSRSSRRGWDLLSECLLQFAPSDKLLPYISDFVKSSLSCEAQLDPSSLNSSLINIQKCEYHLSWSLKSKQLDSKDEGDSSIVTVLNHKRKRSFSETKQNGVNDIIIYSPQTLSSLMKQQLFTFPSEEVPVELITICKQISVDLDNSDDFISLYRSFNDNKIVMKISRNLEKWFNVSCQKGPHLTDMKSIPNMQMMSLHILVYWFESLSQPVISQQMAFLSNFSIKDLTIINKKVLLYMVNFFQIHIISKSKDTVRNIASFLCSLIFQLPKEKYYPLDTPKDSVYMNIVLPIFKKYS